MEQSRIDRINELARISKERPLSEEETAERARLREEYIAAYRASLRGTLDNTYILRPDGTKEKLSARRAKKNSSGK